MEPPRPPPARYALRFALGASLVIATVSGLGLLFVYDRGDAHASLRGFGPALDVVRSVHFWSSSVVVLLLCWRLVELLVDHGSRAAWWATGAALFASAAALEMGLVLRGDQWGYDALSHDRAVPGAAPLTIPMAWWLHLAAGLLVIVSLVVALRPWAADGRAFVRCSLDEARVRSSAWLLPAGLVIGAVAALVAFAPATLGPSPFVDLEVTKPAWPFLWVDPLEDAWGRVVLLEAPVLAAVVLVLYPLAAPPRRPAVPFVVLLVLVAVLGLVGAFGRVQEHLQGGP